jgi:hypothetical protein
MKFIKRHIVPTILITFGLVMLLVMGHLFANEQVGINPTEFVLKAFGKIFYLGVGWLLTHIIIKWFFPTIYEYCHKVGDQPASEFTASWRNFRVDKIYDPRLTTAVNVHIGIFIAICLLLSLAF